jgi:hypothetical protein
MEEAVDCDNFDLIIITTTHIDQYIGLFIA